MSNNLQRCRISGSWLLRTSQRTQYVVRRHGNVAIVCFIAILWQRTTTCNVAASPDRILLMHSMWDSCGRRAFVSSIELICCPGRKCTTAATCLSFEVGVVRNTYRSIDAVHGGLIACANGKELHTNRHRQIEFSICEVDAPTMSPWEVSVGNVRGKFNGII